MFDKFIEFIAPEFKHLENYIEDAEKDFYDDAEEEITKAASERHEASKDGGKTDKEETEGEEWTEVRRKRKGKKYGRGQGKGSSRQANTDGYKFAAIQEIERQKSVKKKA